MTITEPKLILDPVKVKANIHRLAELCRVRGLEFRPHFKTHQSRIVGKWFQKAGVKSITVSSLKMAKYFANDGWNSITIAFPVSLRDESIINELAQEMDLRVIGSNISVIKGLDTHLTTRIGVYIDIDPCYNRTGIHLKDVSLVKACIEAIETAENLTFEGFYIHAGHSYKCRSKKEIQELIFPILRKLELLKELFKAPICFGDTPSCSVLDNFGSIDQISAGNFVFYDWTQYNIGSCSSSKIAVAMFCPVIDLYPARNQILIHGGAVHFSKDSFVDENGLTYYGVAAEKNGAGWGKPLSQNKLVSISQEHGIIQCSSDYLKSIQIGDVIPILPIHSCLTADAMGEYHTLSGEKIDHISGKLFGLNDP